MIQLAATDRVASAIDQVLLVPLKKVVNERGHLLEVQRNDDSHFPGFGQLYLTATLPGVVKAWYRHYHQTDQIALVAGCLTLVLYDTRDGSSIRSVLQALHITDKAPMLVQIPPGVWHGFQATGDAPALLLHMNTIPYDFQHPDEDRLAPDDDSIPYVWSR